MTEPDPFAEANALRDEQVKEYAQYVAVQPIDIGTARAFNVGDPVPASTVAAGRVPLDAVAKTSTKAAAAAVETKG